jgi:hypothetical protein
MRMAAMEIEMFIGMFIIQYVFMSYIQANRSEDITNSVGKVYMCTMMGLFMALLSIILNPMFNQGRFLTACSLLVITIYLYKIQFGIGDKNYLREMIEHHSMALLTSKEILVKSRNPSVINLATRILTTQEKEIDDMKYLLKSI